MLSAAGAGRRYGLGLCRLFWIHAPQTFPILDPSPPLLALPPASHFTASTMDFVTSPDLPLNIPDLDDQYKLTDEQFNSPYTPDREGEG